MNIFNNIFSLFLSIVFISSNIHIIDSAHINKVGDYSICAVDCDHNEHSSSYDDCDICKNNFRNEVIVINNESLINDSDNLFFYRNKIITSFNLDLLYDSRAPPTNIS